jgi:uncharacterized membrane protein HdeD (DUF308 family)
MPLAPAGGSRRGGGFSSFQLPAREIAAETARLWWVFLVTGFAWLLFGIIIFRFDWETVTAISILFGVVCIAAGINEFFTVPVSAGWWKVLRILLGVAFIVVGIVAFAKPGGTFAALAAVFAFFLLFKGVFDIVLAIATKDEGSVWWLQLVIGIVEILLAFWATAYFGNAVILLIVWVAASALLRGITEIIFAFKLHGLSDDLEDGPGAPPLAPA